MCDKVRPIESTGISGPRDGVEGARGRIWPVLKATWARLRAEASVVAPLPVVLICTFWFVLVLVVTLWLWGLRPLVFPATDEAVNRLAAKLVRDNGSPFLTLPFSDPEDRAHLRLFVSVGANYDRAIPVYPPVTYYFYGALACLRDVGYFLIAALPAFGVAAFTAGVAHLMERRRWLAIVAPALGFPALYWFVRPWMNIALMLVCASWGLFYWSVWRTTRREGFLVAALLSVAFGASVRPDYAAHLLGATLCFSLAVAPERYKRIFVITCGAGVLAVAVNLVFNFLLTGHPLHFPYQLVLDAESGGGGPTTSAGQRLLGSLRTLLVPMGLPELDQVWLSLYKYWIAMGPIAGLLVAQLALIPLFVMAGGWRARLLYLGGILALLVAMFGHMQPDIFGGSDPEPRVNHSIPRYATPVYLLAALPPLLFMARLKRLWLFIPAALLSTALAVVNCWEIYEKQPTSFQYIKSFERRGLASIERLKRLVPQDAIVYTIKNDRVLWSRWAAGYMTDTNTTATSIVRAIEAGKPVYIWERNINREIKRLRPKLALRGIHISAVRSMTGLFKVEPPPAP